MPIMCSDALRGVFTLQVMRICVHSLAYYYFDGSNIAWNMCFSWCSAVEEGMYGKL